MHAVMMYFSYSSLRFVQYYCYFSEMMLLKEEEARTTPRYMTLIGLPYRVIVIVEPSSL